MGNHRGLPLPGLYGWEIGGVEAWLRAVVRQRLRHPLLELLDPRAVTGMRGQEFRWLPFGKLLHPFPDVDRLVRVVAGLRSQQETDVVGFGLVSPAERQQDTDVDSQTQRGHRGLCDRRIGP